MKILKFDYCDYYFYPEGLTNLEEFIKYVNTEINRFVPLVNLLEDNCAAPYFIEGETETKFVNLSKIEKIQECEVTILDKDIYDKKLAECISKTCIDCDYYKEDKNDDSFKTKLKLDGQCEFKCITYISHNGF